LFTLLSTKIKAVVSQKNINMGLFINKRQSTIVSKLIGQIEAILDEINGGVELDVVSGLLSNLIETLNEIINPINSEDIIKSIFSNFCVGK